MVVALVGLGLSLWSERLEAGSSETVSVPGSPTTQPAV